jgi:hypothetical protein
MIYSVNLGHLKYSATEYWLSDAISDLSPMCLPTWCNVQVTRGTSYPPFSSTCPDITRILSGFKETLRHWNA